MPVLTDIVAFDRSSAADAGHSKDPSPVKVAVVSFAPVQYNAPLFARLATQPDLDITVLYSSDLGAGSSRQTFRGFNRPIVWDVDLFDGYRSKLLRTIVRPDHSRRWTMLSPSIIRELSPRRYDAVVVYGWEFPTDWLAYLTSVARGIPLLMYSDTDVRYTSRRGGRQLRRLALKAMCRAAAGALYTGTFNRDFYIRLGLSPERLWFSPWSVDNDRLASGDGTALRQRLGLLDEVTYFLFVGKFIERKHPLEAIRAISRLQARGCRVGLLMAGSGTLENEVATALGGLRHAHMLGFVNQRDLPSVYAAADVFVLPSDRDPRATVVNEAMAAGLPVVVSTGTGVWGPGDLVTSGREGIVFPAGDFAALERALEAMTLGETRARMSRAARERVDIWSYETAVAGWRAALRAVTRPRPTS